MSLERKFLERYNGERQLLKSVVALDVVKQQGGETRANFYGYFHKILTKINHRVTDGEIVRDFNRELNLRNKDSWKRLNIYDMHEIKSLEDLQLEVRGETPGRSIPHKCLQSCI